MNIEIKDYYNTLAPIYDSDRFGNSYGQFIDYQERILLKKHLSGVQNGIVWDIACGTGRFMDYCNIGIDISAGMLSVARQKHPHKVFYEGNILSAELPPAAPNAAICFHLIMHLGPDDLPVLLKRMHQNLAENGVFIFDLPSAHRKRLKGSAATGWHGNNAYFDHAVQAMIQKNWVLLDITGILLLPIHRFPKSIRPYFLQLDVWLNRTWLKKFASYHVYILQKK